MPEAQKAESSPAQQASQGGQPGLLEPLTDREQEILRLWALHLSVDGIADQLTLFFHTVRAYVRSVSEKLDAHSREEAISKAENAGLL